MMRILGRGLTESVRYVFWVVVLIVGFLFVCAIVATQVAAALDVTREVTSLWVRCIWI